MKKLLITLITVFSMTNLFSQFNENDSLILVKFYEQTHGDEWTDNTGWLTDKVTNWKGIYVSPDDPNRLGGIKLDDNNLAGPIPNEFNNLPYLEALSFKNNKINYLPYLPDTKIHILWFENNHLGIADCYRNEDAKLIREVDFKFKNQSPESEYLPGADSIFYIFPDSFFINKIYTASNSNHFIYDQYHNNEQFDYSGISYEIHPEFALIPFYYPRDTGEWYFVITSTDYNITQRTHNYILKPKFYINCSVNDTTRGYIINSDKHVYYENDTVKLIAVPKNEHYKFMRWEHNGSTISTDSILTFVPNDNRTGLKAIFYKYSPISFQINIRTRDPLFTNW